MIREAANKIKRSQKVGKGGGGGRGVSAYTLHENHYEEIAGSHEMRRNVRNSHHFENDEKLDSFKINCKN